MEDLSKYLAHLPLWVIFLFTFIATILSFKGGEILGSRHSIKVKKEDRSPIGSIVGATLGLLGFLLAFSFGLGASRFDERRTLVIDEANAILDTYLRADFLNEPYKSNIKELLKEYISVRLDSLTPGMSEYGIKTSESIQDQLWKQTVAFVEKKNHTEMAVIFVQSVNNIIDIHNKRINVGLRFRLPLIIWGMLYLVTFLSIGSLGYQVGLVHTYYISMIVFLILIFSSVILLIWDLDRPQDGFIQVSQQSLIDVLNKM